MTTVSQADADALLAELVATPEGRADPYPRYARLRAQAPVHHSMFGFWALSRFDDCQQLLRHSGVGKDFSGAAASMGLTEAQSAEQARFRGDHSNRLLADPPDHTRLRGLATRAFTPRTVETLRPRVLAIVDELLDNFGTGRHPHRVLRRPGRRAPGEPAGRPAEPAHRGRGQGRPAE